MKKKIGLSLLLGSLNLHAQEAQLEKNITEVQLGLFGLNVNNETKLINKLSVRVSAEFQVSIWDNFFINQANLIVYPTIEIEPKFYYNLNSRFKKDKTFVITRQIISAYNWNIFQIGLLFQTLKMFL